MTDLLTPAHIKAFMGDIEWLVFLICFTAELCVFTKHIGPMILNKWKIRDEYFESDQYLDDCAKHNVSAKDLAFRNSKGLLQAFFLASENRNWWREQYYLIKEKNGIIEDIWKQK